MQAIVLAGGKGERLRPFTNDRPKPMVEVRGIPILAYHLRWLQAGGVDRVVISCGYRHEMIVDYFGDGQRWGLSLRYSVETEPLGRGGGIKRAFALLDAGQEPVVATNGDVITDLPLEPLVEQHQRSGACATVVLAPFISPYGIVELADDMITGFREKPELPYWINAGVYVLSREIYALLPDRGDHEDTTFPQLAKEGRLGGYRSRALWRAVDTAKDLTEAANELERWSLGMPAPHPG